MKKINVAVAGMGLMGRLHARIYKTLENVNLIGLIETNDEIKNDLIAEFGLPVYKSADEILSSVDALSVCTPDHLHKDIILKAFSHNVKVLVEKPLDVSLEGCREILSSRPDQTFLMVGHIMRFDPRVWHIKNAIDSGALGKIYSFKIHRSNTNRASKKIGKRTSINWFLGIHDVDLLLWLSGSKVKDIKTMGIKVVTDHWDYVVSTMKLENGALVCLENGWILPAERSAGCEAGITVIGEKGSIEVDLTHNDVLLTTAQNGRSSFADTYHWPAGVDGVLYGDLRVEMEAFVNSVINNSVPPVTGEQATDAVEVVERIERILSEQ